MNVQPILYALITPALAAELQDRRRRGVSPFPAIVVAERRADLLIGMEHNEYFGRSERPILPNNGEATCQRPRGSLELFLPGESRPFPWKCSGKEPHLLPHKDSAKELPLDEQMPITGPTPMEITEPLAGKAGHQPECRY